MLVLKGICHYSKYFILFFSGGLNQMEVSVRHFQQTNWESARALLQADSEDLGKPSAECYEDVGSGRGGGGGGGYGWVGFWTPFFFFWGGVG